MDYWWLFVLTGLLCGVFSATFGVGSGIILVPILVLLFAFPQKAAQGICLCMTTLASTKPSADWGALVPLSLVRHH